MGSLLIGIITFGIALAALMPNSGFGYYSAGGIFAIVGGVTALARRRRGYGTLRAVPIAAIILGSLAIICLVVGVAVPIAHNMSQINNNVGSFPSSQSGSGVTGAPGETGGTTTVNSPMPTTPSFSTDPKLSAYEQSAASISKSIYNTFNGGEVATQSSHWPTTLGETADGTVLFPSGTAAAIIPSGELVTYGLTPDRLGFQVEVSARTESDIAAYNSETNQFTWVCGNEAASKCPPGGVGVN